MSVVALSDGDFMNEQGFYTLSNLPLQTPIDLTLQEDGTARQVTVTFTLTLPSRHPSGASEVINAAAGFN